MNIFICVDDGGGLSFGGKRQSRDSKLIEYMLARSEGKLYINQYSKILFSENDSAVVFSKAEELCPEDYCFLELELPPVYWPKINRLFVCHWNRRYPSDVKFDLDLSSYKLVSTEEIVGSSHEKITIQEYRR